MAPCHSRMVRSGLGFGVVGDLGTGGLHVVVVEGFRQEADCGPGAAGGWVADDQGVFVPEEGEDGVQACPARVADELGEGDGHVLVGEKGVWLPGLVGLVGLVGVAGVFGMPGGGAGADGERG